MEPGAIVLLVGLTAVAAYAAGFFLADRAAAHFGYARGWADRDRRCHLAGHHSPETALISATRPCPDTPDELAAIWDAQ